MATLLPESECACAKMLASERLVEARTIVNSLRRKWLTGIALAMAILIGTACGNNGQLPSQVRKFPADLSNSSLATSGIYSDGWTEGALSLNLEQPRGNAVLAVRGTIPRVSDGGFHTEILVRIDNHDLARQTFGVGEFRLLAPTSGERGRRRIELTFSATQQLPGGDGRMVGARLQSIGFEQTTTDTSKPAHIIRGDGIQLGNGWGDLENFHDERFRWVDNNAQILLTSAKSGDIPVSLLVEPGPGLGGPFLLKALDASGRPVDAVRVQRRSVVELFLPAEAGKANEFQLHVEGGGKRTANDSRILNFRVFWIKAVSW